MRYITCSRCGIVPENHACTKKPSYKQEKNTEADRFRHSNKWKKKSIEIRERDKYLCQVCLTGEYNTISDINFNKLEVHHIIPIEEDYNKRLDNDNLITACAMHHKMAERGEIPREELKRLVEGKK